MGRKPAWLALLASIFVLLTSIADGGQHVSGWSGEQGQGKAKEDHMQREARSRTHHSPDSVVRDQGSTIVSQMSQDVQDLDEDEWFEPSTVIRQKGQARQLAQARRAQRARSNGPPSMPNLFALRTLRERWSMKRTCDARSACRKRK